MFPVMVRFHWHGVDHLGLGSKLLAQQEQYTLVDGGMWRLHEGPVICEASRCKSRSVSVCDMDVCECKQCKIDAWLYASTSGPPGHLFTACVCCGCQTGRKWTVPRKLSKKCKRLEEGEGASISWMIGRTSCSSTASKRMKSVLGSCPLTRARSDDLRCTERK